MLDIIRSADFAAHLNQTFRISLAEETVDLELIEVVELAGDPVAESDKRRPFSLIFRSERVDAYLPQAIYTLEHERMGDLALFIVPLGPHPDGMRYEVLFT